METSHTYGVCPTCGQSLADEIMSRRVTLSLADTEQSVRTALRGEVEANIAAEIEGRHAAEAARLRKRIDELQRQVDPRNAHDRGVAHEHDVLALLRAEFPQDRFQHEGRCGDIVHSVVVDGHEIGLILYECKNAGTWQNAWIARLKDDGRQRGTPFLVLVSRTMPAGHDGLLVRNEVVVTSPMYVVHVAAIVRQWVLAGHRATLRDASNPYKAQRLFEYLAGEEFRADFAVLLDCARRLDVQLEAERKRHEREWKARAALQAEIQRAHLTVGVELADRMQAPDELQDDVERELLVLAGGAQRI